MPCTDKPAELPETYLCPGSKPFLLSVSIVGSLVLWATAAQITAMQYKVATQQGMFPKGVPRFAAIGAEAKNMLRRSARRAALPRARHTRGQALADAPPTLLLGTDDRAVWAPRPTSPASCPSALRLAHLKHVLPCGEHNLSPRPATRSTAARGRATPPALLFDRS